MVRLHWCTSQGPSLCRVRRSVFDFFGFIIAAVGDVVRLPGGGGRSRELDWRYPQGTSKGYRGVTLLVLADVRY